MITLRGRAFVDGALRDGAELELGGSRITALRFTGHRESQLLLPGFIDLHVHGGGGFDFMDGTVEAAEKVAMEHARHGTTALAATTLSASDDDIVRTVAALRSASAVSEIVAVHFEGPYISPQACGAQDPASIREADAQEFERWIAACGELSIIATVAPEVNGVLKLIEQHRDRVLFSIGHTAATYDEARAAIDAGARHATHLFNAMTPLRHRDPGVVGATLADPRVSVELIADLQHIHPATLRIAASAAADRVTLITDAMRACGMPDGTYKLYAHDVSVSEGAARLSNGALAGSVLTMDAAVRHMVNEVGLPLEAVIPFASTHPARALGVEARKGSLRTGSDADVVVLDPESLQLQRVFARGQEVERS